MTVAAPTEPYATCSADPDARTCEVTLHNIDFVGEGDIGVQGDGKVAPALAIRVATAVLALAGITMPPLAGK